MRAIQPIKYFLIFSGYIKHALIRLAQYNAISAYPSKSAPLTVAVFMLLAMSPSRKSVKAPSTNNDKKYLDVCPSMASKTRIKAIGNLKQVKMVGRFWMKGFNFEGNSLYKVSINDQG